MRLFSAALLLPLLAGVAFAQDKPECPANHVFVITTPAPPQAQASAYDFMHAEIKPGADMIVLGDSIANQLARESDLFSQIGAKQPVLYAGGGDGLPTALYRLQQRKDELIAEKPDRVLIVMGTNNLAFEPCAIEAGYDAYFKTVKSYWPDAAIYVLSILPRGPFFNISQDTRLELNAYMADHQEEFGYKFIQIDDQEIACGLSGTSEFYNLVKTFKGVGDEAKQCGNRTLADLQNMSKGLNSDGSLNAVCTIEASLLCSNFKEDNTHMSATGIVYLADKVAKAMQ